MSSLDDADIGRYARHIVLREVGGIGQERLKRSRVLLVGAGGLGAPLGLYLAAAGVGALGLLDDDRVDLGNLQRQIVYRESDVGRSKVEAMAERLVDRRADLRIEPHALRLDASNAATLVAGYDLVADGSDNFSTRDAVAQACRAARRPLVSAAVQGVEGQLTTFKPYLGMPHPCFRCLFPEPPAPGALPSCAQGGVLGPAAGVMGTLQAVEVCKELLGHGEPGLSGTLLLYDAMAASLDRVRFARRRGCPSCAADTLAG